MSSISGNIFKAEIILDKVKQKLSFKLFSEKNLEEVSQLMFLNHLKVARHLSYLRNNLHFVAKYFFDSSSVKRDGDKDLSFALLLEEGMQDFALGNSESYIEYFRKVGKG